MGDSVQDSLRVVHNLAVGEPQHVPSQVFDDALTLTVSDSGGRRVVNRAVEFHNQLRGDAGEIDGEAVDAVLASELPPFEATAP